MKVISVRQFQYFLIGSLFFNLASLLFLLLIPSDPKNIWVLGYSQSRMLLIVALSFPLALTVWSLYQKNNNSTLFSSILGWLEIRLSQQKFFFTIVVIDILGIVMSIVFTTRLFNGAQTSSSAFVLRITPLISWLISISYLFFIIVIVPYTYRVSKNVTRADIRLFFARWKTNNYPFLLFLPYSIIFAIFILYYLSQRVPSPPEMRVLYFDILSAFSPILFLFILSKSQISDSIRSILGRLVFYIRKHWKAYLIFLAIFTIVYFSFAFLHIPEIDARVRKFVFLPRLFLIPFSEPLLYLRLGFLLDSVLPIEVVSPLISYVFIVIWFAFIIYLNKEKSPAIPILVIIVTFSSIWTLYYGYLANMEFPTAILGFLGMYAVFRRHYSLGMLFLVASMLFKATSHFFIAASGLIFLAHFIKQPKSIRKIDFSLVLIAGLIFVLNYYQLFSYIAVRGGPGYIVVGGSETVFWLTSFTGFFREFINKYLLLSVIAFLGILFSLKGARFAIIALGLSLLVRNISSLDRTYHTLFFVPSLSLLAYSSIRSLLPLIRQNVSRLLVSSVGFVLILFFSLQATGEEVNSRFLTKANSNIIELVEGLSSTMPPDSTIFQRKVGLESYFWRYGREDLKFNYYTEEANIVLEELPQNGCVVWFSPINDLGITAETLISLDFTISEEFYDHNQSWRLLTRSCDQQNTQSDELSSLFRITP